MEVNHDSATVVSSKSSNDKVSMTMEASHDSANVSHNSSNDKEESSEKIFVNHGKLQHPSQSMV